MTSLFTRIITGEIPSHRVYEDEATYAFLDINPRQEGHTLVVPKAEVDNILDLEPSDYHAVWETVRRVGHALEQATGCERVVLLVIGYEVPHAHVHIIPTSELGDVPMPPVDVAAQAGLAAAADRVRAAIG